MKKPIKSTDMPQTEQRRYPNAMENLQKTTACPRSTEYDLEPIHCQEQNFHVVKKGNCP